MKLLTRVRALLLRVGRTSVRAANNFIDVFAGPLFGFIGGTLIYDGIHDHHRVWVGLAGALIVMGIGMVVSQTFRTFRKSTARVIVQAIEEARAQPPHVTLNLGGQIIEFAPGEDEGGISEGNLP